MARSAPPSSRSQASLPLSLPALVDARGSCLLQLVRNLVVLSFHRGTLLTLLFSNFCLLLRAVFVEDLAARPSAIDTNFFFFVRGFNASIGCCFDGSPPLVDQPIVAAHRLFGSLRFGVDILFLFSKFDWSLVAISLTHCRCCCWCCDLLPRISSMYQSKLVDCQLNERSVLGRRTS